MMKHFAMRRQRNKKGHNAASGPTQWDKRSFRKLRGILMQLSRLRDQGRKINEFRCLYSHSCTEQMPCTEDLRKFITEFLDEQKKKKKKGRRSPLSWDVRAACARCWTCDHAKKRTRYNVAAVICAARTWTHRTSNKADEGNKYERKWEMKRVVTQPSLIIRTFVRDSVDATVTSWIENISGTKQRQTPRVYTVMAQTNGRRIEQPRRLQRGKQRTLTRAHKHTSARARKHIVKV